MNVVPAPPLAVAACLVATIAVLAATRRPSPIRPLPAAEWLPPPRVAGPVDATIRLAWRFLAIPSPTDPARSRLRTLLALAVAVTLVAVAFAAPALLLSVVVVGWLRGRSTSARRRRDERRAVIVALPDAVDLLLLCTSAGWSLPLSHRATSALVPAPLGAALWAAAEEADGGRPRADALLHALSALGDRALGLAQVLADHLRYGSPLAPALERLGAELRLDRRRQAEEDARRIPVRLLAPLVICVLPAFALLTVVPLLVSSLRSLPT